MSIRLVRCEVWLKTVKWNLNCMVPSHVIWHKNSLDPLFYFVCVSYFQGKVTLSFDPKKRIALQKFACLILYWFYKKCKMVKNIVNFGSLFGEIVEFACLDHYKLFHRSSILHEHSTAYSSKLGKMLYMIISSPVTFSKGLE